MQKINVTTQLLNFRKFLIDSWNILDRVMENHDWDEDVNFTDDWVQVNWEFLVERQVLGEKERLKPYSSFFPQSRITHPNSLSTHQIICTPKTNKNLMDWSQEKEIETKDLIFNGFVKKMDPGFGWYPPFDYVTVFTENRKVYYRIYIEDVNFYLTPV